MQINRRLFVAGAGASTLLSGCIGRMATPSGPVPAVSFESLLRQIKHDVGTFVFNTQNDRPETRLAGNACAGDVSFAISSVKMSVSAQVERTMSGSVGLSIPLDLLTLSPSMSRGRTIQNTIATTLTIVPLTADSNAIVEEETQRRQILTAPPPAPPEFEGTPITSALTQLRRDLIRVSDTPPCFNFGSSEKQSNTVKWAFTVTRRGSTGGKLTILIFTIGAEQSSSVQYANTIEASFIATGEGFG